MFFQHISRMFSNPLKNVHFSRHQHRKNAIESMKNNPQWIIFYEKHEIREQKMMRKMLHCVQLNNTERCIIHFPVFGCLPPNHFANRLNANVQSCYCFLLSKASQMLSLSLLADALSVAGEIPFVFIQPTRAQWS